MSSEKPQEVPQPKKGLSRREFFYLGLGGLAVGLSAYSLWQSQWRKWGMAPAALKPKSQEASVFIARVEDYEGDLAGVMRAGLAELGVTAAAVKGKKILLKPNLVEPRAGEIHINTHPLVVRGAVETFLSLGAAAVMVAEGPGHRRDTLLVLEDSGLGKVLVEDRIPFIDLNYQSGYTVANPLGFSRLKKISFPHVLREVDWVVSLPKMKTHHWAGATLSMKNLFGLLPGIYYGWPKNVIHWAGIDEVIVDLTATVRPQLAIVDGIVGMEGDGPIMGPPRTANVLVMGCNMPAVDATAARIMGLNPYRIKYLAAAQRRLGPIAAAAISQRGETIAAVQTPFALVDKIPVYKDLRM